MWLGPASNVRSTSPSTAPSPPPSAAASNPWRPAPASRSSSPLKYERVVFRPKSAAPAAFAEEDEFVLDPEKARDFVCQIGDNWRSPSANGGRRRGPPSKRNAMEGTPRIRILVSDGSNGDQRHCFDIDPSARLKTLFNDYAETRGVSLRSLRFSHNGRSLFLSSIGKKSPNDLNMRDKDIIVVHDTSKDNETSAPQSCKSSKKIKKKKSSPKRVKGKKKKKAPARQEPVSPEEHKARHSKRLSKLHEEVEPHLKEIRMRLNRLGLRRQPPKRKTSRGKKTVGANADPSFPPIPGVGGKAGRSHFLVQVGEVQHLYRTAKRSSAGHGTCGPCGASATLDLHGHTREEALAKLDERLEVWMDTAMRGSYPFVISARIVCGCGNQTVAETVEQWIRSTRNVGNAPGQMR